MDDEYIVGIVQFVLDSIEELEAGKAAKIFLEVAGSSCGKFQATGDRKQKCSGDMSHRLAKAAMSRWLVNVFAATQRVTETERETGSRVLSEEQCLQKSSSNLFLSPINYNCTAISSPSIPTFCTNLVSTTLHPRWHNRDRTNNKGRSAQGREGVGSARNKYSCSSDQFTRQRQKKARKPFRLLDLPYDLRREIYKKLFQSEKFPVECDRASLSTSQIKHLRDCSNLMLANKTVRKEAREVLLQVATFSFSSLTALQSFSMQFSP